MGINIPIRKSLNQVFGGVVQNPFKSTQVTQNRNAADQANFMADLNQIKLMRSAPKVTSSNSGATSTQPTTISPSVTQSPAAQNYINSITPETTGPSTPPEQSAVSNPTVNQPSQPSASDLAFAEYIKALQPSQDVTNAETAYNDYVANQSKSVAGFEGQGRGIPLTLIRGQQEKLLKQTQPEALRLQNAISITQNNATLSQNAAKAKFDYLSGKEKPLEIGGNLVKLNPTTGKYETLYQSPKDVTKPASVQEYEYAKSQGYKGSFTDYQNEDANRKAQILSPANISSTINSIAQNFDNEPIVKEYNTVTQQVDALKNAGSTPFDDIQRIYSFAKIMDPNSAVKEGEYKTVQDYATALLQRIGINVKRVFNATGFLTPEARSGMLKTLENVAASKKQAYDNLYNSYNNRIEQAKKGGFNSLPDYGSAFDTPSTDQDPLGLGFNQVGNTSASVPSLNKVMASIGQYESGGNYQAVGKQTANGDRAYGKYQVMGNNIPSWTRTALGKSLTPQQFLNDPKAQDAVARYYMGNLLNTYGNINDVASVWFSGKPASKAGNAKDVNNTSVPKYIANINAIYNKLS